MGDPKRSLKHPRTLQERHPKKKEKDTKKRPPKGGPETNKPDLAGKRKAPKESLEHHKAIRTTREQNVEIKK